MKLLRWDGCFTQGVSQKIKNWWRFLEIGKLDWCLPKVASMVCEKKEINAGHWETPSWERNILEHKITQHTQITTEKCFFFDYHKLGWDVEWK